jgi:signal transduction histidine kinase
MRYLLFLGVLFVSGLTWGQTGTRYKDIATQIHSVTRFIDWPDANIQTYKVLIISDDPLLRQELQKPYISKDARSKTLSFTFTSSNASIPAGTHVVYLDPMFSFATSSIYKQISGKPILLFTEAYADKRNVMINLIEVNKKLTFEFNRVNITNQKLKISPEIGSAGGTELDVAKLYQASQDSIRVLEGQLSSLDYTLKTMEGRIRQGQALIDRQKKQLDDQQSEMSQQQQVIERQKSEVLSLQDEVGASRNELQRNATFLINLQGEISKQTDKVAEGNKVLEEQQRKIKEQEDAIKLGEEQVEKMTSTVSSQKQILVLMIAIIVVVLISVVLIFMAYRARRNDARKLEEQRDELSKLLKELNEAQAQLVQSEKMASLGTLTAGIAHEINNAINFVYSGIQILERKFADVQPVLEQVTKLDEMSADLRWKVRNILEETEQKDLQDAPQLINQMINNIQIGAERTTQIVKGLRTFSRTEAEKKSEIDIHNDLEVALLLLQNRYKEKIEINKDLQATEFHVLGLSGQLGQAFLNLIGNAVDAIGNKPNGAITIQTLNKGNDLIISVRDNGSGIDRKHLDKIFDPFFTTKDVGMGTGLGLSITYGIIERHGGTIQVSSEKNVGTEFRIFLPLNRQVDINK